MVHHGSLPGHFFIKRPRLPTKRVYICLEPTTETRESEGGQKMIRGKRKDKLLLLVCVLATLGGIERLEAQETDAQSGEMAEKTAHEEEKVDAGSSDSVGDARGESTSGEKEQNKRTNTTEEKESTDNGDYHHHKKHHYGKSRIHPFFQQRISSLFFVTGVDFLDLSGLNTRLENAGFSETENPFLNFGGQATFRFGRLVIGAEAHWLVNVAGESDRDDTRYDWKGMYGLFNLGVDAVQYKGLSIYPMVGIGGGKMQLKIAEESGASFDDILADPGREVRLTQKGLLLDASLGVDYRFTMRQWENRTSYFTVGVRGGYLFAPYSGKWKMSAGEVSGGPDFGITGPYVQLMLGFSGKRER